MLTEFIATIILIYPSLVFFYWIYLWAVKEQHDKAFYYVTLSSCVLLLIAFTVITNFQTLCLTLK